MSFRNGLVFLHSQFIHSFVRSCIIKSSFNEYLLLHAFMLCFPPSCVNRPFLAPSTPRKIKKDPLFAFCESFHQIFEKLSLLLDRDSAFLPSYLKRRRLNLRNSFSGLSLKSNKPLASKTNYSRKVGFHCSLPKKATLPALRQGLSTHPPRWLTGRGESERASERASAPRR